MSICGTMAADSGKAVEKGMGMQHNGEANAASGQKHARRNRKRAVNIYITADRPEGYKKILETQLTRFTNRLRRFG